MTHIVFPALFLALCAGCGSEKRDQSKPAQPARQYNRIISFAPSITETLFALGLGDRIVGVTRFCNFPPEAQRKARVGGYTDPNFEMILGLRPDMVFSLNDHGPLKEFLMKNRIEFHPIKNEKLDEMISSILFIAKSCGVGGRGDSIAGEIKREIGSPVFAAPAKRASVLICVGRNNPGSGHVGKFIAAGPETFYSDLLEASGARNACIDSHIVYPEISAEGIVRIQPDVIIDVMPSVSAVTAQAAAADWNELSMVKAVQAKRVFCLVQDYATIPGPRIVLLLRDFRRIIKEAAER